MGGQAKYDVMTVFCGSTQEQVRFEVLVQVLRNQEVPPTGLGKYDGVMMPVLRQGLVVKQNMT